MDLQFMCLANINTNIALQSVCLRKKCDVDDTVKERRKGLTCHVLIGSGQLNPGLSL